MRFVEMEEARAASGVRLVVVGGFPSPWSEAAKGIFEVKQIDGMLIRFAANDKALKEWTTKDNAPVLLVDSEPPRSHWSEILETAERLGGKSLVPSDAVERAQLFGLAHDLLGEGGLVWNQRIVLVDRGLTTEGREGFPLRLSQYLAPKYGHAPGRMEAAKNKAISILQFFEKMLRENRDHGHDYLLASGFSALDIYLAASLAVFSPLPEEKCPMHPAIRQTLENTDPKFREVPQLLLEHRDRVYERHLTAP